MCRVCDAADRDAARSKAMEADSIPIVDGSRYYESESDDFGAPMALKAMLNGFDLTPHEVSVLYRCAYASAENAMAATVLHGVPASMTLAGQFVAGLTLGMHLREVTMHNPPDAEDPSVPDDMKGQ